MLSLKQQNVESMNSIIDLKFKWHLKSQKNTWKIVVKISGESSKLKRYYKMDAEHNIIDGNEIVQCKINVNKIKKATLLPQTIIHTPIWDTGH